MSVKIAANCVSALINIDKLNTEAVMAEASSNRLKSEDESSTEKPDRFKYQAAAFITGVAGASILGGFGMTLGMAKKKDPEMFNKGMMGTRELREAGGALAMRALGWGTLYAVAGFSAFCYGVWKLTGVNNLQEFRMKAGSILPRIPRSEPPQGRTEFSGLNDLFQYLIDEDERKNLVKTKPEVSEPLLDPE